ncbi:MAG: hypothetical protein OXB84_03450, partial [Halobacteriovoraceae bacterium]|nr:hypothetical protein [Halobacteriovoraceae bacterium]
MGFEILLIISFLGIVLFGGIYWFASKKKRHSKNGLDNALAKSRRDIWRHIKGLISSNMDQKVLNRMEELLHASDIGPAMVENIILELKKQRPDNPRGFLFDLLKDKMQPVFKDRDESLFSIDPESRFLQTVMIVGTNGAGKTTTIGKLAIGLQRQGAKVVVGAGDTFRAAAVDQLKKWCDKASVEMVKADNEKTPPSAVAYTTFSRARKIKADFCLLDTAGRLHNNENLMKELEKFKRVLKKQDSSAPRHILLVIDAISGQNALQQAKQFHKYLGLTGIILT